MLLSLMLLVCAAVDVAVLLLTFIIYVGAVVAVLTLARLLVKSWSG